MIIILVYFIKAFISVVIFLKVKTTRKEEGKVPVMNKRIFKKLV